MMNIVTIQGQTYRLTPIDNDHWTDQEIAAAQQKAAKTIPDATSVQVSYMGSGVHIGLFLPSGTDTSGWETLKRYSLKSSSQ
jgi:hypothetical protein